MKNSRRLAFVLGAAAGSSCAVAALLVACSGDNNGTPSSDSGTPDSTNESGGGGPDGTTMDSPMGNDAPADGKSDVLDGGPGGDAKDAPSTDGLSPAAFPHAVVVAFCQRLEQCCAPADAGFDMPFCVQSQESVGGANGNGLSVYTFVEPFPPDAQVRLDPTLASKCLADNTGLPCGVFDAGALLTIRNDCFGAMVGLIPVNGTGCRSTIECAPSGYCRVSADGGADAGGGKCVAILEAGAPCVTDDQCSYRGTGIPAQFCDNQTGAYGVIDDGGSCGIGTNTCTARAPTGGACSGCGFLYNNACVTEICNGSGVCDSLEVFSDPGNPGGVCDGLKLVPDAGGD